MVFLSKKHEKRVTKSNVFILLSYFYLTLVY